MKFKINKPLKHRDGLIVDVGVRKQDKWLVEDMNRQLTNFQLKFTERGYGVIGHITVRTHEELKELLSEVNSAIDSFNKEGHWELVKDETQP
jgi:hypothetical protein